MFGMLRRAPRASLPDAPPALPKARSGTRKRAMRAVAIAVVAEESPLSIADAPSLQATTRALHPSPDLLARMQCDDTVATVATVAIAPVAVRMKKAKPPTANDLPTRRIAALAEIFPSRGATLRGGICAEVQAIAPPPETSVAATEDDAPVVEASLIIDFSVCRE